MSYFKYMKSYIRDEISVICWFVQNKGMLCYLRGDKPLFGWDHKVNGASHMVKMSEIRKSTNHYIFKEFPLKRGYWLKL